jgi:hypothetical protein
VLAFPSASALTTTAAAEEQQGAVQGAASGRPARAVSVGGRGAGRRPRELERKARLGRFRASERRTWTCIARTAASAGPLGGRADAKLSSPVGAPPPPPARRCRPADRQDQLPGDLSSPSTIRSRCGGGCRQRARHRHHSRCGARGRGRQPQDLGWPVPLNAIAIAGKQACPRRIYALSKELYKTTEIPQPSRR